jgi:general secretion pathway protein D
LLLNGEQTVIGGLFVNDETTVRNGIPILKDLPWWVFGLRYLFGSDSKEIAKKELVILIKADLVPTLKERLATPQPASLLEKERENMKNKMKIYEFNQSPTNEN